MPTNRSRLYPAMAGLRRPVTAYVAADLVELGREAGRISERERAERAEIEALREIKENQ